MGERSAEGQLSEFLAKFSPEVARTARAARAKVRKLLPGAVELVYDNYNALAIGFGPTDRASDVILSIALFPRWVSIFFMRGAQLADPAKRLRGGGKQVRHIVLEDATTLDEAAVRALVRNAVSSHPKPLDPASRRRTVIKSVSAKQRPRRPVARRRPTNEGRTPRRPMADKSRTIDEYLARLSADKRAALEKLRKAIRGAAPRAEERISYGVPAFRLGGRFLVGFGAAANHCAFYPTGTAIAAHRADLAGYDTSKGTIRFQPKAGLPARLVRKLVRFRIATIPE